MPSILKAIAALPTTAAALASLSTTYRYNNTVLLPSLEERLQSPPPTLTTYSISPVAVAATANEINSSTGLTSISHVASVVVSNFLPLSTTSLSSGTDNNDDSTSGDDTRVTSSSTSTALLTSLSTKSLSTATFYPSYSPPVVESLVASSAEEFSNNFRDLSFDIFDDNDNDLFGSPLAFDASENGLWNGRFVPPPPRPPFFVDEPVLSDGLTTCDLCSWAMPTKSTFIFEGTMEKASELGWPLTLTIVSILSAILGAIIMIAVVKCRRKKTSHQRSGKCQHHSPKQQLPLPSVDHQHNHLQQQEHLNQQHVDHDNMNQHHNLFYLSPPNITTTSHQYLLPPTSTENTTHNFKQLPLGSHHQQQQLQLHQQNSNHKRSLGLMQHLQQQQRKQQHLDHHLHHHPRTVSSSSSSNDNSSNCTTQTSLTTLYPTKSHNELKSLNIIDRENSILKRPLPPRPDECSEEDNVNDANGDNDSEDDNDDEEDEDNVGDDDNLMPDHYVYEEPTMQESITAVVVVAASGNDTHVQWWSRNKRPNGNNNHLRRSNIYTAHPADSIRGLQQPNSLSASSSMTAMTTAMTIATTAPTNAAASMPYYHHAQSQQQHQQQQQPQQLNHGLGNQQYLQQYEHEHEYHQPQELQLQIQPQQQLSHLNHHQHTHKHAHAHHHNPHNHLHHQHQHQHSASISSTSTNSMPSLSTQPLQMQIQIPEQLHLQSGSNPPPLQHIHMQYKHQQQLQHQQHEQDLDLEQPSSLLSSSSDLHDNNMFHWPTATTIVTS